MGADRPSHGAFQCFAGPVSCGHPWCHELAKKKGRDAIAEYLTTVRFQPSARKESGELYKEHGRAERAAIRDLVDIAGFDRDMMGLLDQFCTGKR